MPKRVVYCAVPIIVAMDCACGRGMLMLDGSVSTLNGRPAYRHRCNDVYCPEGSVDLDRAYPRQEWVPGENKAHLLFGDDSDFNVLGSAKWSGR